MTPESLDPAVPALVMEEVRKVYEVADEEVVALDRADLTVASDGRPWSVERMSVIVSQVGKSRGDP